MEGIKYIAEVTNREEDPNKVGIFVYFYWAFICKRLRSPGIDSEELIPPGWESIPVLLKSYTNTGSVFYTKNKWKNKMEKRWESIPGLHKGLKKRALFFYQK